MEWKLELVPIPVSNVDYAKAFYTEKIGFHEDLDHSTGDTFRVVQLTPPRVGVLDRDRNGDRRYVAWLRPGPPPGRPGHRRGVRAAPGTGGRGK